MELAFLVYIIDLVLKLSGAAKFFIIVVVILTVLWGAGLNPLGNYPTGKIKEHFKKYYPVKTLLFALLILWIIPNQQTMKYMGAAYLVQSTFESEFVQETATLSQKAIIKQLKEWSEDAPEISPMLEQLGVEVKDQVQKEIETLKENTYETK